jgi:type I restriction-modification system DNA methylase subunit
LFERLPEIDLSPNAVSKLKTGYLFEVLVRRLSELSNQTAGEYFMSGRVIRPIMSAADRQR